MDNEKPMLRHPCKSLKGSKKFFGIFPSPKIFSSKLFISKSPSVISIMSSSSSTDEEEVSKRQKLSHHNNKETVPSCSKHPLLIPEILQKIFNYLNRDTLKTCRRVNRFWNIHSSSILLYNLCNTSLQIRVKYSVQNGSDGNLNPSLQSLSKYLNSSIPAVPCLNFHVHFSDMDHKPMLEFLHTFGHNFKSLHVKLHQVLHIVNQKLLGSLKNLLLDLTPNIEQLTLELSECNFVYDYGGNSRLRNKLFPSPKCRKTKEKYGNKITLPNLLKLRVENVQMLHLGNEIIGEILDSAINLKVFEAKYREDESRGSSRWLTADYVQELVDADKIGTVKTAEIASRFLDDNDEVSEIRIYPMQFTKISKLEQFANSQPKLETLVINFPEGVHCSSHDKLTGILTKIFQSSQHSLKKLLTERLGFLEKLKIPICPNVKELHLLRSSHVMIPCLNMGQNMAKAFPNVKKVTVEEFFIPETTPFPSVQELTLRTSSRELSSEFLSTMGKIFHNVSSLIVQPRCPHGSSCYELPNLLTHIMEHFSFLKSLSLLNFGINCTNNGEFQRMAIYLDATFCGLTVMDMEDRGCGQMVKNADGSVLRFGPLVHPSESPVRPLRNQMTNLTCLHLELNVGLWSAFMIKAARHHPIFAWAILDIRAISNVKIILMGNVIEGQWGVTCPHDFSEKVKPHLVTLLSYLEPYLEIKLNNFLPQLVDLS